MQAIKGAVKRYMAENMSDRAAALTYYSVLSLFPALIAVIALVGVFGKYPETTDKILQIIETVGPSTAVETFRGTVESVVRNKGGAGALLGIGLLGALWAASGYVAAFMRASNDIYEVPKDRRLIRKLPVRLGLTVMMTILLAAVAIALVLTGPLMEAVGGALGLASTAVTVWSIAKWPVLVLVAAVAFSLLYFAAPNARQPSMRATSRRRGGRDLVDSSLDRLRPLRRQLRLLQQNLRLPGRDHRGAALALHLEHGHLAGSAFQCRTTARPPGPIGTGATGY